MATKENIVMVCVQDEKVVLEGTVEDCREYGRTHAMTLVMPKSSYIERRARKAGKRAEQRVLTADRPNMDQFKANVALLVKHPKFAHYDLVQNIARLLANPNYGFTGKQVAAIAKLAGIARSQKALS